MSYIKELRKLIGNKRVICVAAGAILENEKEEILLQLRSCLLYTSVIGLKHRVFYLQKLILLNSLLLS